MKKKVSSMTAKRNTQEAVQSAPTIELTRTLDAARVMARGLAQAAPDDDRLALARAFCSNVVRTWWAASTSSEGDYPLRDFPHSVPLTPLPEPAQVAAQSIGEAAATLEADSAAYAIGLIYTGMLPADFRSRHGVFYTPPALTERLIEQATNAGTDWARCRVLDPACGGGAFLAPVARRILEDLKAVTPAILVNNIGSRLRGYEVDPFSAWLAQVSLDVVMLPVCREARRRLPVVVSVCDSLRKQPPRERFDLVIGNPPYGRVKLAPEVRQRYRRSLYGHANLYGLFTDMALRHTRTGGVIAYVTPTSFLAGEYFKNLRSLLGRTAPPVIVDLIASRKGVFEGVLQETLLATYRKGEKPVAASVHEVRPDEGVGLRIIPTGSFVLPKNVAQPWLVPRSQDQSALIERLLAMPHRLADWGYAVSTGPLVWNRHKTQLRKEPGAGRLPLIWSEAVTSEGRFTFRAEKKNHEPYFKPNEEGDDWLITRAPCVLLQRTTAKEQSRRLIAAALPAAFLRDHGAVVIENHLNMIRPLKGKPLVSPAVLAVFLNSAAADRAFRCVSGSVAVSAYELETLPLPAPEALSRLVALVRCKAKRDLLEAECERIYAAEEGAEA